MNDDRPPDDERSLIGCSAIFFVPLSAFILNEVLRAGQPNDLIESIVLVLLHCVAVASLLFFSAGLLWAVSGLDVIKRQLDFFAMKFAWSIIPFLILIITLTAIAVIKG